MTWRHPHRARGFARRLTLRRHDGAVYLDRWGFSIPWLGGVLLHRMDAPDPGIDLHDHPWWFASLVLSGGYSEERLDGREAAGWARRAQYLDGRPGWDSLGPLPRGRTERRRRWSWRPLRLDECHRIVRLDRTPTWTLVINGPVRRGWGFFTPDGWLDEATYDETVRSERRDLWSDQNSERRPWARS